MHIFPKTTVILRMYISMQHSAKHNLINNMNIIEGKCIGDSLCFINKEEHKNDSSWEF